ncbi:MAG TPA: AMP-binding protein [Bryobacteraceae bacterium]|nr:AMP-binding protein [Bryobacteraceae bacterium]
MSVSSQQVLSDLYRSFPPLRPVMAGLYGYQLRWKRYGLNPERLVEMALERETWLPSAWERWQKEELARVLHHAATRVPYYRTMWAARRRAGDRSSPELLENWPILEKEELRKNFRGFVSDKHRIKDSELETTSGTTGSPVTVVLPRRTVRAWYALCEARFRRWNGITRDSRWAMIGSQLVAPVQQTSPPFWVWNEGLNQLYMSAYHLTYENLPSYLEAMARYKVEYVWGHSSALNALTSAALRSGQKFPQLRIALSSSEPLTAKQRIRIGAAFRCPVRETYGMSEMVAGASECEAGRMHLWPEVGFYEVVEGTEAVQPGNSGDLICTSFLNREMPLIRYRVGDRVALSSDKGGCKCGRLLPMLASIDGRASDMLFTKSGRMVTPTSMEIVFDVDLPIREGQIVQESLQSVRVIYVPNGRRSSSVEQILSERVRARLGDVDVVLEPVQSIPRGANGKLRAVVCALSSEEKRSLRIQAGVAVSAAVPAGSH